MEQKVANQEASWLRNEESGINLREEKKKACSHFVQDFLQSFLFYGFLFSRFPSFPLDIRPLPCFVSYFPVSAVFLLWFCSISNRKGLFFRDSLSVYPALGNRTALPLRWRAQPENQPAAHRRWSATLTLSNTVTLFLLKTIPNEWKHPDED